MIRSLEFISRFVSSVGVGQTEVQSIRISNETPNGGFQDYARVEATFSNKGLDAHFLAALTSMGLHVDDVVQANLDSFQSIPASEIKSINFDGPLRVMRIFFSKEQAITPDKLISMLKSETVFGLPQPLFSGLPIAKLNFHFGTNQEPMSLNHEGHGSVSVFEGIPYLLEETSSLFVDWYYVGKFGKLILKRISAVEYLSQISIDHLSRFSLSPKVGLKISGLFLESKMNESVPYQDWIELKGIINNRIEIYVSHHTQNQLGRVSERVKGVHHRSNVYFKDTLLGKEPVNEVETVLLFERMCHVKGFDFPEGLRVKILDYSPRDIDSICEIYLTKNSPVQVGPVEFEFALKSFFDHGHDYRQVKLIICYTISTLTFPYSNGGITYTLDTSFGLPKLRNSVDETFIPCLILNRLIRLNA